MSTENIVKNQYYRILKNATQHIWNRISYWTHADDVELENGTILSSDLAAKDEKISDLLTDFAPVERSATASQAYMKGQCLIYDNQFYRAIAAIARGNALVVGTNIQVMSASEISTMLTANNGSEFYFDVKDGKYGFYPNASKTSSEFIQFGSTEVYYYYYPGITEETPTEFSCPIDGTMDCLCTAVGVRTYFGGGEQSVSCSARVSVNGTVVCNASCSSSGSGSVVQAHKQDRTTVSVSAGDTITVAATGVSYSSSTAMQVRNGTVAITITPA